MGGPGEEEAVLGAVGQEDGEDVLGTASELAENRGHLQRLDPRLLVGELLSSGTIDLKQTKGPPGCSL